MYQFRRDGLEFDVLDVGRADGPVVVLLHGFIQSNTAWDAVIPRLAAQGYRCLAPNQRGYSTAARPTRRRDYRQAELIKDVLALIDTSGAQRVHLVSFDWGAAVSWALAAHHPERLVSLSALAIPHSAAMLRAMVTSRQALMSWYVPVYNLPAIPERVLLGKDQKGATLMRISRSAGQPLDAASRDVSAMTQPGALSAALNWYRGLSLTDIRRGLRDVEVPTLYMWADGDSWSARRPPAVVGDTSKRSIDWRRCTDRIFCSTNNQTS
jgi:pimeloyl-ACP methyl ester carboxylesterase